MHVGVVYRLIGVDVRNLCVDVTSLCWCGVSNVLFWAIFPDMTVISWCAYGKTAVPAGHGNSRPECKDN